MKCPVCSHELHPFSTADFDVDICSDGCAGIWFDRDEFEKCNESTEPFPAGLLRVKKVRDVVVDRSKLRACPKCEGVTMERIMVDPEIRLEIDRCGSCGGHWLDIGELEYLRKADQEDRELQARLRSYEQRVNEQARDSAQAERLNSLVKSLFR